MFNFIMKKMLKSKMKGIPEAEQDKILVMVEKNPAFFQQIATEVQAKMKEGKDQMTATMEVMQKHKDAMQKIMSENK